jgi:metallophosphoesterase superfamily enzyme
MGRAEAEIEIAGERLTLLPERALLWPRVEGSGDGRGHGVLFVADLHLGKSETLRAHGMAVPEMDLDEQFERLLGCVERTGARELVIVGDLVHASAGLSERVCERAVAGFLAVGELGARTVVVLGNHDRHGARLLERLAGHGGVEVAQEWRGARGAVAGGGVACVDLGCADVGEGVVARHVPRERGGCGAVASGGEACVEIAAHLHPAVSLGSGVKLPCFWVRGRSVVLPAFSRFTGGGRIEREAGDRVYAIADDRVIDVSGVRPKRSATGSR